MLDKNIEIMKKIIETKKEKSARQGLTLRPDSKNSVTEKVNTRRKRR